MKHTQPIAHHSSGRLLVQSAKAIQTERFNMGGGGGCQNRTENNILLLNDYVF